MFNVFRLENGTIRRFSGSELHGVAGSMTLAPIHRSPGQFGSEQKNAFKFSDIHRDVTSESRDENAKPKNRIRTSA
jgi:hypothetical protein